MLPRAVLLFGTTFAGSDVIDNQMVDEKAAVRAIQAARADVVNALHALRSRGTVSDGVRRQTVSADDDGTCAASDVKDIDHEAAFFEEEELLVYSKCIDDVILSADVAFSLVDTLEGHAIDKHRSECPFPVPFIIFHEIYVFFQSVFIEARTQLVCSEENAQSSIQQALNLHLMYRFLTVLGISRMVRSVVYMMRCAKLLQIQERALNVALDFAESIVAFAFVNDHDRLSMERQIKYDNKESDILIIFLICIERSLVFSYSSSIKEGEQDCVEELIAIIEKRLHTIDTLMLSTTCETSFQCSFVACMTTITLALTLEYNENDDEVAFPYDEKFANSRAGETVIVSSNKGNTQKKGSNRIKCSTTNRIESSERSDVAIEETDEDALDDNDDRKSDRKERQSNTWIQSAPILKSLRNILDKIFHVPNCVGHGSRSFSNAMETLVEIVRILKFYQSNVTSINRMWLNGIDNENEERISDVGFLNKENVLDIFYRICLVRISHGGSSREPSSWSRSVDNMAVCDSLSVIVVSIAATDSSHYGAIFADMIENFSISHYTVAQDYVSDKLIRALPESKKLLRNIRVRECNTYRDNECEDYMASLRFRTVRDSYDDFQRMLLSRDNDCDTFDPAQARDYYGQFESHYLSDGDPFDIQRIILLKAATISNALASESTKSCSRIDYEVLCSPSLIRIVLENLRAIDDALRLQLKCRMGHEPTRKIDILNSHVIDTILNDVLNPLLVATHLKEMNLDNSDLEGMPPLYGWLGFSTQSLYDSSNRSPIHVAPFGLIDEKSFNDTTKTAFTFSRVWSLHSHLNWLQNTRAADVTDDLAIQTHEESARKSGWDLRASILLIECYFRWVTCASLYSLVGESEEKDDEEFSPFIIFGCSTHTFNLRRETADQSTSDDCEYLASMFEIAECISRRYSEVLIEKKNRLHCGRQDDLFFALGGKDENHVIDISKRCNEMQSLQHFGMSAWMWTLKKRMADLNRSIVTSTRVENLPYDPLLSRSDVVKTALHGCRCCCGELIVELAKKIFKFSSDSEAYLLDNENADIQFFEHCDRNDSLALLTASLYQLILYIADEEQDCDLTALEVLGHKASSCSLSEVIGTFNDDLFRVHQSSTLFHNSHKQSSCTAKKGSVAAITKVKVVESMIKDGAYSELLMCNSLLAEYRCLHDSTSLMGSNDNGKSLALCHRLLTETILAFWQFSFYYPLLLKDLSMLTTKHNENVINIGCNTKKDVWGFQKQLEAMKEIFVTEGVGIVGVDDVLRVMMLIKLHDYIFIADSVFQKAINRISTTSSMNISSSAIQLCVAICSYFVFDRREGEDSKSIETLLTMREKSTVTSLSYRAVHFALVRLNLLRKTRPTRPLRHNSEYVMDMIQTADFVVGKVMRHAQSFEDFNRLHASNHDDVTNSGKAASFIYVCLDVVSEMLSLAEASTSDKASNFVLVGELSAFIQEIIILSKFLVTSMQNLCRCQKATKTILENIDCCVLFGKILSLLSCLSDYCDHHRIQTSYDLLGGVDVNRDDQRLSFRKSVNDGMWIDSVSTVVLYLNDNFLPMAKNYLKVCIEHKVTKRRMRIGKLYAQCKAVLVKLSTHCNGHAMSRGIEFQTIQDNLAEEKGDEEDEDFEPSDWSEDDGDCSDDDNDYDDDEHDG